MVQIDMEMPKSCNECIFKVFKRSAFAFFCQAYTGANYIKDSNKRLDNCPLREVK